MAAIDWSDPERLKQLEARYSGRDIVEQRRRFVELARPTEGEHCLDIGCGPAFLVEQLQAAVGATGSVAGVDSSEPMVRAGLVRCPTARLVTGSADELPFPEGSFDLVTITQVRCLTYWLSSSVCLAGSSDAVADISPAVEV